jgi:DNA-binding response OmpR family regulator
VSPNINSLLPPWAASHCCSALLVRDTLARLGGFSVRRQRGACGPVRRLVFIYNEPVSSTIFLVEDDADIADLMRHHLTAAGFGVRAYAGASHVLADAERNPPHLFLLDVMLPGGDGFDLCRRIRQHNKLAAIPIIFVTAKGGEADRVAGLELGADDYITKPFSPKELIARVRAVLRRFERPLPSVQIHAGELEIDGAAMHVRVRGSLIETTATEFRLLQYLATHPGRVFTRDQILDAVWRDTAFVTPRSVDVYIRRLREKIERDPENPQYIRTLRGAGYRFEVPK